MKVGFIGVGAMGSGMAKNALRAGFEVWVFDAISERAEALGPYGARIAKTLAEVAANVNVAVTMLPVSPLEPYLEQAIHGDDGLLAHMKAGSIIIDGGNTSPDVIRRAAEAAAKRNIKIVDAPVSGGPTGAHEGSLSIMVGGDTETVELIKPLLRSFGKNITHIGEVGAGQTAKLVNNMIVAINLAGLSEALVFGTKLGLNPETLLSALEGGAADSWVLRNAGRQFLTRGKPADSSDPVAQYLQSGGASSGGKPRGGRDRQLSWAIALGAENDIPLPLTTICHELYKIARASGKTGGFKPLLEWFEDMANTKVQ